MTLERIRRFQALMKSDHMDASMIKTVSSFAYFTDVQWLRELPHNVIPQHCARRCLGKVTDSARICFGFDIVRCVCSCGLEFSDEIVP